MSGPYESHGARPGAHDDRVGLGAPTSEADAPQKKSIGDPGGSDITSPLASSSMPNTWSMSATPMRAASRRLVGVTRAQDPCMSPPTQRSAAAAQDTFWRPADAEENVDAVARSAVAIAPPTIAVGDQPDACPGLSNLIDQLLVAG